MPERQTKNVGQAIASSLGETLSAAPGILNSLRQQELQVALAQFSAQMQAAQAQMGVAQHQENMAKLRSATRLTDLRGLQAMADMSYTPEQKAAIKAKAQTDAALAAVPRIAPLTAPGGPLEGRGVTIPGVVGVGAPGRGDGGLSGTHKWIRDNLGEDALVKYIYRGDKTPKEVFISLYQSATRNPFSMATGQPLSINPEILQNIIQLSGYDPTAEERTTRSLGLYDSSVAPGDVEQGAPPPNAPQPPPNDGSFSPQEYEQFKRRWYAERLWEK